jgi:hypothetical protein
MRHNEGEIMKPRLSSILSILLLAVLSLTLLANADTASAASACNAAQFVADVTIPDGTFIAAGSSFAKTWRLKNIGTCTWTTAYSLVFSSGEKMGGPDTVFFTRPVSPGQAVDITVTLTAPTGAGTFRGYWQLKNASGSLFGIGTSHASPFWVEIKVLGAAQSVVAFDFVTEMCSAQWIYDGGPISCPVNTSKKDLGYVLKLDNPVLENGQSAGVPGLLTIPQNKYNGLIRGMFTPGDIFRGDHFQALIGCQYGAVDCYVTFMLEYEFDGGFTTLWKTRERYDGLLTSVDVDLTRLANLKNSRIVLTILASGPSGGDQPVWVAPRIVRNVTGDVITPTPISPTSTVPTLTPVPTTSAGCDRAQFISDVTVPDGTTFAPNAAFTKTWRLQNVGSCTWTTGYSLVFVSGDRMGGVETLLPQTVVPGQVVDVGVNFTAPNAAGSYRGYWQLKDPSGFLFGIGSTFDRPFFVDIKVSGSSSGGNTALDFVGSACSAQWFNGTNTLPCPGTDGDARGFVLTLATPVLENGSTDSRPGLLTFPQNINNGYIQGIYPTFTVQSGDRFQATLNCQYGATDCFVIYRVDAEMAGGVTQNLGIFGERYDGLYYPADIDLSSLAGKNVNFILTVMANGSATGDRAVWVAPRIVRGLAIGGASFSTATSSATATSVPATDTPVVLPSNTPLPVPSDTPAPIPTGSPMPTATQ